MSSKRIGSNYLRLLMSLLAENNATILIVDDEREILHIIGRFLRHEGYQVIEAPRPSDAIEICKSEQAVDLVLSDYNMPNVTGIEMGRILRTLRPTLPMVFMTADHQIEQSLLANGFICLRKPLLLAELETTIAYALKRRTSMGTRAL
jgi:CheY-like chemotaxis protein